MEDGPILTEAHFYWGNCFVCKKKSSKENPVKRCSRCKSVYYCSQEHQVQHFKKHKKLCKYLASASDEVGQYSFFSGMESSDLEKWKTFRMNAVITCEIMFGNPLSLAEREIFLFPRICRVCRSSQDKMYDCEDCYCLSYCSEQHRDSDRPRHQNSCRQLRIAMLADVYESCVSVGLPPIPSHVDKTHMGTAPDITHFITSPNVASTEISKAELEYCFLANQLSGPLTLLDCLERYYPDCAHKESLTVHVVGSSTYEMMGLIKWEYLIHRLPSVKDLQYFFVGPGLQEDDDDQPTVHPCEACESSAKTVIYHVSPLRYSQFKKSDGFTNPDLVLVQNAGFSEFDDDSDSKGWVEGWKELETLLPANQALLIFTSYTEGEAKKDLERFLKYTEGAELVVSQENPMKSLRPCRDWENDRNQDVFFANQFVTVVRRSKD